MVALVTRIPPREELESGIGFLKDIIAIIKNPKALDDAHEEAIKKIALNESEVAKLAQARKLIAEGDKIKEELAKREDAIKADKDVHEAIKKGFEHYKNSEELRLGNLVKELKDKHNEHEAVRAQLATTKTELDNRKKIQDDQYQQAMRQVEAEREKNRQDRQTLNLQASELGQQKQTQDDRDAQVLRLITGK